MGISGVSADHELPLPAGALARLGTTRLRHPSAYGGVAVPSPDGSQVAIWADDSLHLHDFPGGTPRTGLAPGGAVKGVAWLGKDRLAVAVERGTRYLLLLWDPAEGEVQELAAGEGGIGVPAADPAGRRVAVASLAGPSQVLVVEPGSGTAPLRVDCGGPPGSVVMSLAFSPDGTRLTANLIGQRPGRTRDYMFRAVDLDPGDGRPLGGRDLAGPPDPGPVPGLRAMRAALEPRPADPAVTLGPVWGLALSPDGTRLATGDRIFELASGRSLELEPPADLLTPAHGTYALAFEPGGGGLLRVYLSRRGGSLERLDPGDGRRRSLHPLRPYESWIQWLAPDGSRALAPDRRDPGRGVLRWLSVPDLAPLASLASPFPDPLSLAACHGPPRVAALGPRGELWVADPESGAGSTFKVPGVRETLAFGPGAASLALLEDSGGLRVLDLGNGSEIRLALPAGAGRPTACFAPDGRLLVVGTAAGGLLAYGLRKASGPFAFPAHRSGIRKLVAAPDGTRLYTGSDDGTVLVWDLERLRAVCGD